MTKFYFVRHGETSENKAHHIQGRRDIPLNDNGISQAYKAGEFIKGLNISFDKIYSSPLSRAVKTAEIIKDVLGLKLDITKSDGFIERSFGVMEGAQICDSVFYEINRDNVEGLEKSFEIQKRVSDEVFKVTNENTDKNILVVAHSHTIKALTTMCDSSLYHFDDKMSNCAITIVSCDGKRISIIEYNINTL